MLEPPRPPRQRRGSPDARGSLQRGPRSLYLSEQAVALTYPFHGPPAPGESLEILPGIHWVRLPLPLKLDHVNVWVLEDGDGLTVVDTGVGDERTRALLAETRSALPRRPLTRILVTHHHPDHCGLVDRLVEEHGAELLMSSSGPRGGAGAAAPGRRYGREVHGGSARRGRAVAGGTAVSRRE